MKFNVLVVLFIVICFYLLTSFVLWSFPLNFSDWKSEARFYYLGFNIILVALWLSEKRSYK